MEHIKTFNFIIAAVFFACYFYQFCYIPVSLAHKSPPNRRRGTSRIAVCICARNEETVISNLLESIKDQDYPAELIQMFVCADNCTDNTAIIARMCGARVYERFDAENVGKGYGLSLLLERIEEDAPGVFDAFLVLDADNALERDYISAMADTFSEGHKVVTGYRNTKNYGDNWLSAGYGLWFLRESRYLNAARMALGTSCAVSGTGFMFSRDVLLDSGGWVWHLLTEDIEFSADRILGGDKIAYCGNAVLYDEQPTRFAQSWRQRLRWSRGYMQVLGKYGPALIRRAVRGDFSSFDMVMNIAPAFLLSLAAFGVNLTAIVCSAVSGAGALTVLMSVAEMIKNACLTMFVLGAVTTATEWKNIHCPGYKKVLYMFTFPVFMLTYIPISIAALFGRVTWKPIEHTRARTLTEIRK